MLPTAWPRLALLATALLAPAAAACGARSDLAGAPSAAATAGDGGGGSVAGPPACAAGDPPVALVSGLSWPFGVAVDETHVYFTTYTGLGTVTKVPKGGGDAVAIATGLDYPDGLAVDADHVYVAISSSGVIQRMGKDGSGAVTVGKGFGAAGVALDEANVYWTSYLGNTVDAAPKAGGGPTLTLAPNTNGPYRLAVDADHVYWTALVSDLGVVPKGGGPVTSVAGGGGARSVTTHGGRVFWTDPHGGAVWSAGAGGVDPLPLTPAQGFLDGLVASDDSVYVAVTEGDILRIPVAGGAPEMLATGQAAPAQITMDASCVYWTNTAVTAGPVGAVMRAPR